MTEYRITTNGYEYRIEYYGTNWRGKPKWRPLKNYFPSGLVGTVETYLTEADASEALAKYLEWAKRMAAQDWKPVRYLQ